MRNWRTMAVFLGPRQTMAEEREGRRRASDMACRDPILLLSSVCTPAFGGGGGGGPWPFDSASFVEGAESEAPFWTCDRIGVGMGGRVCEE